MNRRDLLKTGGMVLAGTAAAYGLPLLTVAGQTLADSGRKKAKPGEKKWGMVIDVTRCSESCNACAEACKRENNVAQTGKKDEVQWDVHRIRRVVVQREFPAKSPRIPVPVLCNHCDNPPCAQACPVAATYKREDGIVIVDHHRCIGCRYCMIACPYNARYFNYKENHKWPNKATTRSAHGVPESCHFCSHRLRKKEEPACVEACKRTGARAMIFGDLNDPKSEIARYIARHPVKGMREDWGTRPKVFYKGL